MKTLQNEISTAKNGTISLKATTDSFGGSDQPQKIVSATSIYAGPLPPPEAFAKYDKILPGAADRLLSIAEAEAKHRHKLEETKVSQSIFISHMGQIFAFVLGMTGLAGGIYCASIHEPWAASAIVGSGLAALIAPFLRHLKTDKK